MRRTLLASLVGLCAIAMAPASLATIAAASGEPQQADVVASVRHAIALGVQQARDHDLTGAAATLASAIRSEGFTQLPQDEQFQALAIGTVAANGASEHSDAFDWSARACALPPAQVDPDIWHERLEAAYDLRNYADSAGSITTIARRWPQTLQQINASAIRTVAARLDDDPTSSKTDFELLRSLFDAKWLSDGEEPAWMWADLARMFLEQRDTRSALAVVARVDSPTAVAAMRVDRRFDKLSRADPAAFDMKRAITSSVIHAEERARANPRRLQPVVQLEYVLLKTRQPERALRLADEMIAKAGRERGNYDDFGEFYPWMLDIRAASLWQLGRWGEALTQQRHAARYPEHGELNVSQALNLSSYYAQLGRVDDAIDATSDLGATSPYGRMQLEAIGLIGALQSGNAAELEMHLGYMRSHRSDALSTYQDALLDANRLNDAADLLVERLQSSGWRTDALAEMQIYAGTPMTPLVQVREARRRAVIDRTSVQKALAKVGRIEEVPLTPPGH